MAKRSLNIDKTKINSNSDEDYTIQRGEEKYSWGRKRRTHHPQRYQHYIHQTQNKKTKCKHTRKQKKRAGIFTTSQIQGIRWERALDRAFRAGDDYLRFLKRRLPTTPATMATPPRMARPTRPSCKTLSSMSCLSLSACLFLGSRSRRRSL